MDYILLILAYIMGLLTYSIIGLIVMLVGKHSNGMEIEPNKSLMENIKNALKGDKDGG